MAEFVTFIGIDASDSSAIPIITVTVYASNEAIVLQDQFGPGLRPATPIIAMEPGEYTAWVRADGYRFTWREPFTVEAGDAPDLLTPLVVDFQGTSTAVRDEVAPAPFLVTGYVRTANAAMQPGQARLPYGVPYDTGPNTPLSHVALEVTFTRVGASAVGELGTILPQESIRTSADRHGYFSATLSPETRYEVSVPGVAGTRYLVTGEAGDTADLEALIDADATQSLLDWARG